MESGLQTVGILIINGMLCFAALHRLVCGNNSFILFLLIVVR